MPSAPRSKPGRTRHPPAKHLREHARCVPLSFHWWVAVKPAMARPPKNGGACHGGPPSLNGPAQNAGASVGCAAGQSELREQLSAAALQTIGTEQSRHHITSPAGIPAAPEHKPEPPKFSARERRQQPERRASKPQNAEARFKTRAIIIDLIQRARKGTKAHSGAHRIRTIMNGRETHAPLAR